ncbi:hypothetical protein Poli38472_010534 [Pythium oligandrum]|uniref:Uncharacterized protein n=1 Tax=Pythium oligandrum TaxID=41045 RepID=A0A8K1FDJ4_PYTOL|nr:hypothetical protein Poli38472_010534 [Pythium oligandrum]|eukprot:TMW55652.1 hypothetical protein Poli38472_010534 [Pythium oligandrum]
MDSTVATTEPTAESTVESDLKETPPQLLTPKELPEVDIVQLVNNTEDSQPNPEEPHEPTARKEAWVRVIPPPLPFPNIFEFVPRPETNRPITAPGTPEEPVVLSVRPATSERPRSGIQFVEDVVPAIESAPRLPEVPYSTEMLDAQQAEKTYATPLDIPELGWRDVFQLGLSLTYKTLLLRRDISPRCMVLDEDNALDAAAFCPLTGRSISVFAAAGLAFNQSTEDLVIRQKHPAPPVSKPPSPTKRRKPKKSKQRRRSPRKLLVRPVLPPSPRRLRHPRPPVPADPPNKVGNMGAIAIFRALRVNASLRSLALENAGLGDVSMCALAAMLPCNCSLTSLSLRENAIGPMGIQALSEALVDSPDSMLLRLDLSRNRITDSGLESLCFALEENETLVWLDLSWNQLSSMASLRLLASLRENFTLREVAFYGKDLDEDQYCHNIESKYAKDLGAALRQLNPSFAEVALSSATAKLPVDKMKHSRWLCLPDRSLAELDALVIAGLLPLNPKLLTLDLSNNREIERWGVLEILKSIKYCKTLQHVNLANTGLYEEVAELVGDLIASNDTLAIIVMHERTLHVQQLRGKDPVETMAFKVATDHHMDRWILAKCLALNRPTQEMNALRLPKAAAALVVGGGAKLVSVNLSGRTFDMYEVVFLAKKIFHHLQIGRVAMNGCGIESYGGVALADAVRNHASLATLELENNNISSRGGRAMVECVQSNSSLTYLNLSWNKMGNDGAIGFDLALKANKTLLRLDLRGNTLSGVGIRAIAAGLKGNACLQELYLRWNSICPNGAEALAEALTNNKSLRVLDIEHHTMGPRGGLAFAVMLEKNTCLQDLNMKGDDTISDGDATGIGPEAAQKIAVALTEKNKTLTHFSIAQNQIGRDGIVWFSNLVKFNTTLRQLDLSISSMDGKIADRFFDCLSMNKTLIKLNLAHNRISNEGMASCIRALERNRVLQDLNLAHNAITEEPLALLSAKIQSKPGSITLKWLCLIGNTMTHATRRAFVLLAPKLVVELDEAQHRAGMQQ